MAFENPLDIAEKLQALPPYSTHISSDGTKLYFVNNNEISCVFTSSERPWTDRSESEIRALVQMYIDADAKPRKR